MIRPAYPHRPLRPGASGAARTALVDSTFQRLSVAVLARRFGGGFGEAEAYGEHVLAELAQRHDVHVFCHEWVSTLWQAGQRVPR